MNESHVLLCYLIFSLFIEFKRFDMVCFVRHITRFRGSDD